jgi:hypothetical protein
MAVQVVVEADILQLRDGQAIQIGVNETKSSPVLMDEGEGRTTYHRGLSAESFGNAADERGFSRSKFPTQGEYLTSAEECADTLSEMMRLSWRPQQHAQRFIEDVGFRSLGDRLARRDRRLTGAWWM